MSNPNPNAERFSLKHFANRVTASNTKVSDKVQKQRKVITETTNKELVTLLLNLGKDLTESKNKGIPTIIQAFMTTYSKHKNPEEYISPSSAWDYTKRYGVYYDSPKIPTENPTKEELRSVLASFQVKVLQDVISLGYSSSYAYNERGTHPSRLVYLLMCRLLTKDLFNSFRLMKSYVRAPVQLHNIFAKMMPNLSQEVLPPPQEAIKYVIEHASCKAPEVAQYFQIYKKDKKSAIDAMRAFIANAQPTTSSPAYPWVCMKRPNDDESWGRLESTNDPLKAAIFDVIDRLLGFLNGALGKTTQDRQKATVDQAMIAGASIYDKLYSTVYKNFTLDKVLMKRAVDQSKLIEYLCPHIIFTLSSGNVKPVTAEEIKQGKPNRGIFQSPAVIRIMYMFLASIINTNWKHPSKMANFGWQGGGTERLLNALFEQVGFKQQEFIEKVDYLKMRESMIAHDVTFPQAAFAFPDIKAQDQFFHDDIRTIMYKVVIRDLVYSIDPFYRPLFAAYLGFAKRLEEMPIIMTNANVIFTPKHLNISGGMFNSAHSNNHSACLAFEAQVKFKWPFPVKIAHVANGDDAIMMFYSEDKPLGFSGELGRLPNNYKFQDINSYKKDVTNNISQLNSALHKFATYIKHRYSCELKPETLSVHPVLSMGEYLGANIYVKLDPEIVFMAARPPEKIFFSMLWGQTVQGPGVSPTMIAAMRTFSAYADATLIYKDAGKCIGQIYNYLKSIEGNRIMPTVKYFESDFFDIDYFLQGKQQNYLPELPSESDLFTWMTGITPKDTSLPIASGDGEFEAADDDLPGSDSAHSEPLGKEIVEIVFEVADDVPDDDLGTNMTNPLDG